MFNGCFGSMLDEKREKRRAGLGVEMEKGSMGWD